jgi:hypothetical protein
MSRFGGPASGLDGTTGIGRLRFLAAWGSGLPHRPRRLGRARLAAELSRHFSGGRGFDGPADRTGLWQPSPVETLTALDVAIA